MKDCFTEIEDHLKDIIRIANDIAIYKRKLQNSILLEDSLSKKLCNEDIYINPVCRLRHLTKKQDKRSKKFNKMFYIANKNI